MTAIINNTMRTLKVYLAISGAKCPGQVKTIKSRDTLIIKDEIDIIEIKEDD